MKISTSMLFDRATERMSTIQNRLATTQAQMAETKQVLSPSDAPDQAAAIQRLHGEIDRQDSHIQALKVAMQRFSAEETALKSSSDILTRVKELGLQAGNDTLSPEDRKAVGVELKALRQQLVSLGNSRDAEDNVGVVTCHGAQTETQIPAGVERVVQFTRAGTDVFSRVVRQDGQSVGFFDALDHMIKAVDNSDTQGIQQGISDASQMSSNLDLALAHTGSDQKVVQSQLDVLNETTLRLKSSLSQVEDLDYASAVTKMNKEMMALQAAMGSFSKISSLSLFEYIK